MTLRCQDALDRLAEGLTGSIPPVEREAVVEHLATCARCRDEAAQLESLVARLRGAGEFSVPPGFWLAFTSRLEAQTALERLPRSIRFRRWLVQPRSAVAAMVATVGAALVITTAVRIGPRDVAQTDSLLPDARGLVTETMTTTLPSLGEMLDVWRAGFTAETDTLLEGAERRPR